MVVLNVDSMRVLPCQFSTEIGTTCLLLVNYLHFPLFSRHIHHRIFLLPLSCLTLLFCRSLLQKQKKTKKKKKRERIVHFCLFFSDFYDNNLELYNNTTRSRRLSVQVGMKRRSRTHRSHKNCHQCRKRTVDSVATCKKTTDDFHCPFLYCQKCLFNRYGENAEEKATLSDWICPRCRGICNCSSCMRKRGDQPTGVLVHEAKANGFSSVAEMLDLKKEKTSSSENMSRDNTEAPSKKRKASEKGSSEVEKILEAEGVESRASKLKRLRNKNGGNSACGRKAVTSGARKTNPQKRQLSKDGGRQVQVRTNADFRMKDKEVKAQKQAIKNASARRKGIGSTVQKSSSKKTKTIGKTQQPSRRKSEATLSKKASRESTNIKGRRTRTPDKGSAETQQAKKQCNKGAKRKKPVPNPPLPQGIELRSIDAIDIPAEDVGNALQFLEFCEAFGEVLNLKKGQTGQLLRELACDRSKRQVHYSSLSQLHIQLLSLIWKKCGKKYHLLNRSLVGNSWFQALAKYISGSQYYFKHLQLDRIDVSGSGYEQLDSSAKLRIINFLCDEALGTVCFRSLITAKNIKSLERENKAKAKFLAESGKARNMRKPHGDTATKAILLKTDVACSTSENGDVSSEMKLGVTQLRDNQEAPVTMHDELTKEECRPNIIRCEPTFVNGRLRFWKLSSYLSKMDILLQEIEKGDPMESKERWYSYDIDQRDMVEKYIASFRD